MGHRNDMGLVTAPTLYRGTSPPLALHNHASITPSGGTRTSSAHRADLSSGAMVLVSEAANHVRSSVHRDPVSGLYLPGVLLEPQRENIILQSEDLTATWTHLRCDHTNTTSTTLPDGSASGTDVWAEDGTATNNHYWQQGALTLDTGTWCFSVFVESINRRWIAHRVALTTSAITWFDLDNGEVGQSNGCLSAGVIPFSAFARYWFTFTGEAGAKTFLGYCVDKNGGAGDSYPDAFDGANQDSYFWWGAQLEKGSYPSSYIKTTAASVTRTADSALVWTLGSEMARGEWTLLVPVAVPTHTPAADTKLLSVYKDGAAATDHVSLWADTSKQVKLTSAASGKGAGSVVVTSSDCCDDEVHWVSIHARDGQLHCRVQSNDGQFHAADTDAGIALDLDRLSIEPSGGWVGGVYMQPRFRQRMPRPVQQQLLAA